MANPESELINYEDVNFFLKNFGLDVNKEQLYELFQTVSP